MEPGYEFDSLTELPPLPHSDFSLPPLPPSDFTPLSGDDDSFLLESVSPLSLLTHLHLPFLQSMETNPLSPPRLGCLVSSSASSSSNSTLEKRRRVSDKIKSLEKLMPCDNKMDMATVLEEAHTYITFLRSQIAALTWMPLHSVYSTAGKVGETDPLRSLTRQQILQVIANSPAATTLLYTRRLCLFSHEQLLSLNMVPQ